MSRRVDRRDFGSRSRPGDNNGLQEGKTQFDVESEEESEYNGSAKDDDYSDEFEKVTEAQLLPGDAEKKSVLNMFDAMRKDSYFCDVAMISQGVLFRAHRVVVSSWSRWLRALLCEAPDEEVVSFDFFDPQAFGAVLDYMYGIPILISVDVSNDVHFYFVIYDCYRQQ